jgi:hypothetical protein
MEENAETQIDPLNRKAYIWKWDRTGPEPKDVTYWFCPTAEGAATWDNRAIADRDVSVLNIGVRVPSIQGGIHSIRNFTVEPFGERFVISCSGPFLYTESSSSAEKPLSEVGESE